MKKINLKEKKSIEHFFQFNQKKLLKAMHSFLTNTYKTVYYSPEFVFAVGDIPVALVAHLDTVFPDKEKDIFFDQDKQVFWSPQGLGADDRAGVYSIVQIIKDGYKPHVIFTTDEEIGAVGAYGLTKYFPKPPVDIKYIIELDRRGSNDCVFYECDVPEFEEYIESFGFTTNFGTFSDISIICPAWGIAGVNLSIGYENEHTKEEILHVNQMYKTIEKVKKMLDESANTQTFIYKSMPKVIKRYSHINDYTALADDSPIDECAVCGGISTNIYDVITEDGWTVGICGKCLSEMKDLYWCESCHNLFIDENFNEKEKDLILCKDCREAYQYDVYKY